MRHRLMTVGSRIVLCWSALCLAPNASLAQSVGTAHFQMPSQSLAAALHQVARATATDIMFQPDSVAGRIAPALSGDFTAEQAVERLIAGMKLSVVRSGAGFVVREQSDPARTEPPGAASQKDEIVVTGTHIRGAAPASPVLVMTQQEMRERGYNDLGEAIRALPSNFSGGQNPTVAEGAGGRNNENLNGSSSLNLRGLGADATLTLINGHRLSYDGVFQGVDISAIPLAAVDRLEIVPDGASALYGSDAVGGVANVILKRDFTGLDTSARLGGSTDGGNFQQEYTAVTGSRWATGGALLAGDYSRSTAVSAGQRSYTDILDPSATLIPRLRHINILASGHQDLTGGITFEGDALYSVRHSASANPYSTDAPATDYGITHADREQTLSVAPKLSFRLPGGWSAALSGTYGFDNSRLRYVTANPGADSVPGRIDDNNQLKTVEFSAEGALFSLPGGAARLALGAGYHDTSLHQWAGQAGVMTSDITASRENEYGYAELFLPFIGPAQQLSAARRLSLDLALRYESYPDLGNIARPKLGLVYEPVEGLVLKGSWGKSFKAPTLLEQFSATQIQAVPASILGSQFPASATTLLLFGANGALKPEKATTWTVTMEITPSVLPGMKLSVDYFHIHYRDRVVAPIASFSGIYNNPVYARYVTLNPTQAQVAAALATADQPVENLSGGTFDPSGVVALIDDINANATTQSISGVDASLRYDRSIGNSNDAIHVSADITYLHSRQRVIADQPSMDLAGTIYNPPHWRANATFGWSSPRTVVTLGVNYVGSVTDNLLVPQFTVRSMTTFDLVASQTIELSPKLMKGITIRASVLNLFNRKPAYVPQTADYVVPFDSTNYSSIGRYLGVTLDKSW